MPAENGTSTLPPPVHRSLAIVRRRRIRARTAPRLDARPGRLPPAIGGFALIVLVLGCLVAVALAARGPSSLSPPSHSHFFPAWLAGPLAGVWPFPATNTTLVDLFDYSVGGMYVVYILAIVFAPRLRVRWILAAILAAHIILLMSPPLPLTDVFNYINYGRMEIVHHLNPYAAIPALEPHGDPAYAVSNWHHLLSPYGPLFTIFTFALVPLGVATSFWIFKATLMLASLSTLYLLWRCAEMLDRNPPRAVLLVGLNPAVLIWGLGGDHNDFLMVLLMVLAVFLLISSQRRGFSVALSIDGASIGRGRRLRRLAHAGGGGLRARREAAGAALLAVAGRRLAALHRPARRWAPARVWAGPTGAPRPGDPLRLAAAAPTLPPPRVGWGRGGWAPGDVGWLVPRRVAGEAVREKVLHVCAGLAIVGACAIKLPAAILVPILWAAAPRRLHLLIGMAAGLLAVGLASYGAFGPRLPDLGVQSNLVTTAGLPNLIGGWLGLGGETAGLRTALTGVLLAAVALCSLWAWRRDGDWIVPAAVAVLVLVLTLSWQVPWYVLWLLPLAALARRPPLRVAAVVVGLYLTFCFTSPVNLRPPTTPLQQMQYRETKYLVH